jgi:hypothetical protein
MPKKCKRTPVYNLVLEINAMTQKLEEFVTEITEAELGNQLHAALSQVSLEGDRFIVRLPGLPPVAIVTLDDLKAIELHEDALDRKEIEASLEEMRHDGGQSITLEALEEELGDKP